MNGGPYAIVRTAAADIGHRLIDVGVARFGILFEQRRRGHNLTRLAVSALGHLLGDRFCEVQLVANHPEKRILSGTSTSYRLPLTVR
jgi:hypothetical protein